MSILWKPDSFRHLRCVEWKCLESINERWCRTYEAKLQNTRATYLVIPWKFDFSPCQNQILSVFWCKVYHTRRSRATRKKSWNDNLRVNYCFGCSWRIQEEVGEDKPLVVRERSDFNVSVPSCKSWLPALPRICLYTKPHKALSDIVKPFLSKELASTNTQLAS